VPAGAVCPRPSRMRFAARRGARIRLHGGAPVIGGAFTLRPGRIKHEFAFGMTVAMP